MSNQQPTWLTDDPNDFPPVDTALEDPNGLLALGGDLSKERLLAAYQRGIFPWYNDDQPILWWSPNPRAILNFEKFHISKSFKKCLNKEYDIFFDRDFSHVLKLCQAPRVDHEGTWITDSMKHAYLELFEAGYAHCIEVERHGELLGGLYGVSIGHAFFGESMFSLKPNGSKLALYFLIEKLKSNDFTWLDCQVWSQHLESLGSEEISRSTFIKKLDDALSHPTLQKSWSKL